jgi:glycosyl transferase family 25
VERPFVTLTRADIRVWVINLDQDSDRMAAMANQLDGLQLPFTRFSAIYGKDHYDTLIQNADKAAYQRNMGSNLLPGKLGVFASHTKVWEDFVASDHDIALILEDDVVFHDDFLHSVDLALANADRWDTLRFNCIRAKMPVPQGKIGEYALNAYIGPFTGNACYLIHKSVAKRILPGLWPQTRAFDHELNRFYKHDFRQFGLEPFSTHVDDGGTSSITGIAHGLRRKLPPLQRLPHYRLKAANYFRRFFWLAKHGHLWGHKS